MSKYTDDMIQFKMELQWLSIQNKKKNLFS